jgi:hypothetical protein
MQNRYWGSLGCEGFSLHRCSLQRNRGGQSQGNWRALESDPDSEWVITNLLSCVTSSAGHCARNRDRDWLGAGIASCRDGDTSDGVGSWVDGVCDVVLACIAGSTISECLSDLGTH